MYSIKSSESSSPHSPNLGILCATHIVQYITFTRALCNVMRLPYVYSMWYSTILPSSCYQITYPQLR